MATLYAYGAVDMTSITFGPIASSANVRFTYPGANFQFNESVYPDAYEILWGSSPDSNRTTLFGGTGLTFDVNGNVTGGTVNAFSQQVLQGDSWAEVFTMDDFAIPATVVRTVYGADNANATLLLHIALGGDDTVLGSDEADVLLGINGDDVLRGYMGNDTIDGGFGDDTAVFSGSRNDYVVWKQGDAIATVGPDGRDSYTDVETFTFINNGNLQSFTTAELLQGSTDIETAGATRLNLAAGHYFLRAADDSGPALQYGGSYFTPGQLGDWHPIAAEASGAGYLVALQNGSSQQFTVWNANADGSYAGNALGLVSGADAALVALENTFHQDLNGDGAIGASGAVVVPIETSGATSLVQSDSVFQLQDAEGAGPILSYGGSAFHAGQFGGWTPIAAEASGTGYLVAWQNGSADQYTVWTVDAAGNYTGGATGIVSGSDTALQLLETSFQQDLNGDGTLGVLTTVIEDLGATTLAQAGSLFQLQDGTGAGPTLKFGAADVVAGQFGGWAPIAAEAMGGGYMVAFQNGSADQFCVWNVDPFGNYNGGETGIISGSDFVLQRLETNFLQDLNGDGTVGLVTTTLEYSGTVELLQVADEYALTSAGPMLHFGGAAVHAGQFGGGWAPIAAEASGTGFKVAWQNGTADQYCVWNVDSLGNFTGTAVGLVSGSDHGLQALETLFQQDLNGNGTLGLVTTSVEANGATSLMDAGGLFMLGNAGPVLQYGGQDVVAGQFGTWAPTAAEAFGSGYLVVFQHGDDDQFCIWATDAKGAYTGGVTGAVDGSNPLLVALEASFHQDLNGSGILGT